MAEVAQRRAGRRVHLRDPCARGGSGSSSDRGRTPLTAGGARPAAAASVLPGPVCAVAAEAAAAVRSLAPRVVEHD